MTVSISSAKPLPHLPSRGQPEKTQKRTLPLALDDEAKVHLWKLIHTWLRHEQLQAKWASVINDILMHILHENMSTTSFPTSTAMTEYDEKSTSLCIQLFETGSAAHSKYLPSTHCGTPLQLLSELPLPNTYAGTIRLYGVPQLLHDKLVDIMALSVYTLYSMQLETSLMREHHVLLSTKLPQRSSISTTAAAVPTTGVVSWKYGLLGWILGKRNDKQDDNKNQCPEKVSTDSAGPQPKRRLSLLTMKHAAKKQHDIADKMVVSAQHYGAMDPHHYKNLRSGLEHACISTSPSCVFVTPAVITLLEQEEENMNTMKMIALNGKQQQHQQQQQQQQQRQSNEQPFRSKLSSLARRSSSLMSLVPTERLKSPSMISLPQSITAYSILRVPTDVLHGTDKAGLNHLYFDASSIESFIHHQHIIINYTSYPIGCPDRPCLGPTLCAIRYFKFDDQSPYSDQPLGTTLERWLDQCHSICKQRIDQQSVTCNDPFKTTHGSTQSLNQSQKSAASKPDTSGTGSKERSQHSPISSKIKVHGCNQPLQDHILCFSHGSFRINVYFVSATTTMDNDSPDISRWQDKRLQCWLACTICDARTKPQCVSSAAYCFSFAKYLELCLYSKRFAGLREELCQHTSRTPSALARCFGRAMAINQGTDHSTVSIIEVRFVKEDIDVYALRGSLLQAAEERQVSIEPRPRISKLTMEKWKTKEGLAVDDLFRKIRQHLSYLQDQVLLGQADSEISKWRVTLDADHEQLSLALKNMKGVDDNLNDFRRYFTMKTSTIVEDLTKWQLNRWPQQAQNGHVLFSWDGRPDYMNADVNETIHCFPDSAIMIRELEPTSIIAYTLSSKEYIEELKYTLSATNELPDIPAITTTPTAKQMKPNLTWRPNHNSSPIGSQNSNDGDQMEVVDGYYSSMERKYIAPATGSSTETASFRTMVMETVKNNVSDIEHHTRKLSQMKQRWHQTGSISSLLLHTPGKTPLQQRTMERDWALSSVESAKDIKESTVYRDASISSRSSSPVSSVPNSPSMGPLPESLDDSSKVISPHVKHRFAHGDIEFTCIIYYANEFEELRKLCGVDQLVCESLARCQMWSTTGGKSKSRFYKTQDNRLVIKEMVTAWNIAEKDAFLRFAPKYFDYIKATVESPTILAKIFGFYSVQIRTVTEKKQIMNMDVLVMEHLFYKHSICKTFDFKGIPDRQVDEERRNRQDITLWDGDWNEAYRMGYVVDEQSREWIRAAIQRDTQFLASGNIMDYSLLVGVDKTKKELTVGIVDFIGAYTWYKRIESRSKSTIHRNREVTILPPEQYRLRFCKEVLDYFIPIPGKFDSVLPEQTNPSRWMR